jgi:hypothetical protein
VSPFRSNNCGFSSSTSSTSMVSETRALVRVGIIRRVLTGSKPRDGCRSDHGMDSSPSSVPPSRDARRKDARSLARSCETRGSAKLRDTRDSYSSLARRPLVQVQSPRGKLLFLMFF